MTRTKLLLSTAVIAVTALAGVRAKANPVYLGYSTDGGATIQQLDSGSGSAGVNGYDVGKYTISLSATGSPTLVNPNFGSNTLTVKSSGSGTIMLYASETNDKTLVPSFVLGLSNNPLSDTTVTESVYLSSSNQEFALTSLLGTAILTPGQTTTVNSSIGSATKPYSITEVYGITFGASGGTVDATILEKSNVPEPVSLSLLGAGLAGLGFVRLRRNA